MIPNLKAAYARAWVRVKGGNREPAYIVAEIIIPVISLSAYAFMYSVLRAPPQYAGFVVIGGVMISFWSNVLWNMSAQFYWEKETGNLEMYLIAPVSRMAILLGMALGGALNTTMRAMTVLLVGSWIFQVPYIVGDAFAALLLFMLTLVSLYALGMLFSSLFMLYGREAWHTANLLTEPVYFMSGFYFPISFFPFWLQLAASFIPVTLGLDGIRQVLIMGRSLSDVYVHVLVLVASVIVLFPLASLGLRYMENLGKREGRLTLRWQ